MSRVLYRRRNCIYLANILRKCKRTSQIVQCLLATGGTFIKKCNVMA